MASKKLTSLKMSIAKLDYLQMMDLYSWLRKKKEDAWKKKRAEDIQEHCDKISSLPEGTLVVFTDGRYDFCGQVGKIVRHLGRGSPRTLVDFGESGKWHVPRKDIDDNVSEEKIKGLIGNRNLSRGLTKVLSQMNI